MDDSQDGSSYAAHGAQYRDQRSWLAALFRRGKPFQSQSDNMTEQQNIPAGPDLLALRQKPVEDVAIPKADIVAIPCDIDMNELLKVFKESGLSRLPVYSGTLDKPVGMLHLKDFALNYGFNRPTDTFDINTMLRPLLFVPPSMPIGVLFQKMQSDRRHMALIIDEYGGVDGLVTIEDLIEQVMGEIADEHDAEDDQYWHKVKPGVYIVQAKTPLDEFEEEIDFSLTEAESVDEEEIDTLGGLVFMIVGRVPVRGEVIEHPTGTMIEVIEADARRIKRLRVTLPEGMYD